MPRSGGLIRDRDGELVEPPDDDDVAHVTRCRGGWLDRDSDPAVPCLRCRPHLADRLNITRKDSRP
jgi:hypothetical protein